MKAFRQYSAVDCSSRLSILQLLSKLTVFWSCLSDCLHIFFCPLYKASTTENFSLLTNCKGDQLFEIIDLHQQANTIATGSKNLKKIRAINVI